MCKITINTMTLNIIIFIMNYKLLKADISNKGFSETVTRMVYLEENFDFSDPIECKILLDDFADTASNFTNCSIKYARPVRLCEKCIDYYVKFRDKYQELLNTSVNGTACKNIFISHDRLDAVLDYHDNIMMVWNKGNCNGCYSWPKSTPVVSNNTVRFYQIYNETMECIVNNLKNEGKNYTEVCENCMQIYMQLNDFYETLSTDPIGLDTICMDVVDAMNATRSIWSKSLNCCRLRKSPEIIFLCCTAIIATLPLLYYLAVRFCGPIRDLPNVLKQSRLNQTITRAVNRRIN